MLAKPQFDTTPGKLLFSGKIIDVRRDVSGGYTMGSVLLAPLEGDEQDESQQNAASDTADRRHMVIPFQNEYLYAAWADASGRRNGRDSLHGSGHRAAVWTEGQRYRDAGPPSLEN
jgi:hypothetical protein